MRVAAITVALLLAGFANYQIVVTQQKVNEAFSERDQALKVMARAIELLSNNKK